MKEFDRLPLIRASELAQYDFCRRAWWLRTVKKRTPTNNTVLERGTRYHYRHGYQVLAVSRWRWLGTLLMVGGVILVTWGLWVGF